MPQIHRCISILEALNSDIPSAIQLQKLHNERFSLSIWRFQSIGMLKENAVDKVGECYLARHILTFNRVFSCK